MGSQRDIPLFAMISRAVDLLSSCTRGLLLVSPLALANIADTAQAIELTHLPIVVITVKQK